MRRREFIAGLGAVAWPLVARAQQPAKLPTIGFFGTTSATAWSSWSSAFVQRLRELGWIEGNSVAIEYRWAEGRDARFAEIAHEFVRLKVDVIVTSGAAGVAVKQATSTIPVVLAVANDPLGAGLVTTLARPGGNVTGLSLQSRDLEGKRLGLLREVLPDARRLAVMANVGYPAALHEMNGVETAARALGFQVSRTRNPTSGRHHAGFRGSQRQLGCAVRWHRSARQHEPGSNKHARTYCTAADDYRCARIRRSGSSHVLWPQLSCPVSPCWRLCRQNSARCETRRPPSRATNQIRTGDQSHDSQGAWTDDPTQIVIHRRRGDRIRTLSAAARMVAYGR